MSEARSQMHNPFAVLGELNLVRLESFYAQVAEMEQKALEQSKGAFEESTRLSRESLAYGQTLAAEWRKASLEAARRATQMMANPFAAFGA
jgi:hypothetical protein